MPYGDGGDELFGGYTRYARLEILRQFAAVTQIPPMGRVAQQIKTILPRKASKTVEAMLEPDILWLYNILNGGLSRTESMPLREYLHLDRDYDPLWALRKFYFPDMGQRRCLQYMDFHTWLPDNILTKTDRVSMLNGLEVRVPFLSKDLVEFAFKCPEDFIYRRRMLKGGLRMALKDRLPREILMRKKRGFGMPVSQPRNFRVNKDKNFQRNFSATVIDDGIEAVVMPQSGLAHSPIM